MLEMFRYTPLDEDLCEIRLVKIHPGSFQDELSVSFEVLSLLQDNGSESEWESDADSDWEEGTTWKLLEEPGSLEYEALSYVWGSTEDQKRVYLKSSSLRDWISVTQNLEVALRHLRYEDRPRIMWIDALCIDQKNDDEKSDQIPLMGLIYKLARRVIVWLGPEQDDSTYALELLQYVSQNIVVDWYDVTMRPSDDTTEPEWADENLILPYKTREMHSIYSLSQRPWFERTWVRQEITLASKAVVKCGNIEIDWEAFRDGSFCIRLKRLEDGILGDLISEYNRLQDQLFRVCKTMAGSVNYESLRLYLRGTKCTDPRDAIYAIQSLLRPSDYDLGIEPDYTRTARDVYIGVAQRLIGKQHTLGFITSCELASTVISDIPSWVPDWSSQPMSREPPHGQWSACAWISAQANVIDGNVLRCAGIQADTVIQIHTPAFDDHECVWDDVISFIRQIKPAPEDLNPNSSVPCNAMEAILRTISLDGFGDSYFPHDETRPTFSRCLEVLKIIWSTEDNWAELSKSPSVVTLRLFLTYCHMWLIGRCFFRTTNGFVGLAPVGTQSGDSVCVLLGSRSPLILRPCTGIPSLDRWRVVGACYAEGLMWGEVIHGTLPSHYRPVCYIRDENLIDGWFQAILDIRTEELKLDPSTVLNEMGIQLVEYQNEPHLLEVSPSTLRDAGVKLQDFYII